MSNEGFAKRALLEIGDKEYTLEFNRASIKRMEERGFSVKDVDRKVVSSMDALIEGALYKNHPGLRGAELEAVKDEIYDNFDVQELMAALMEMFVSSVPDFGGGSEKKGFQDSEIVHHTATEAMEELCPIALSWGMPWELYWYGEMSAILSYYEKWKFEEDKSLKRADYIAWLQGTYIQKAVHSLLSKDGKYPEMPYYLEQEKTEKETEEERLTRQFLQLDSWKRAIKKNMDADKERP